MTEHTFSLEPFYEGWDKYQQLLMRALAPLSPEQLELRAAPHLRSIYDIAAHILGARARWMHYVLEVSDECLVTYGKWDYPNQPRRSAAELVEGLERTWRILQDALQRWTSSDMEEILHDTEDDGTVVDYQRQWVIWHLIEHDMHHGGEISFSLGMHNLAAIDI